MKRTTPRLLTAARFGALGLALGGLTGCDWVGSYLKEKAMRLTLRSSWSSFNIQGTLPENFQLEAEANYSPSSELFCLRYEPQRKKEVIRSHYKINKTEPAFEQRKFDFKFPVSYSIGLCKMRVTSVQFSIDGRYGAGDWQRHGTYGGLRMVKTLPENAKGFDDKGALKINGICSWLFKLSTARAHDGELIKLLDCKGAGAFVQSKNLAGKKIILNIQVDANEKPASRNTWQHFQNGWMPCFGSGPTDNYGFCDSTPGKFKKFKLNGQECTIYPGCIE